MRSTEIDKTSRPLVGFSWKIRAEGGVIYSPVKRLSQPPDTSV